LPGGVSRIEHESQRGRRYLVAAMAAPVASVAAVRRELGHVAPRGRASRRHFVKESDVERRKLLAVYRALPGIDVLVYEHRGGARALDQRERCLDLVATELLGRGACRLVLDHVDDAQRRRDRRVLARRLDGTGVSYGHEPAHSREPMLWVPDAAAWCAGRSDWRSHIDGWATIRRA
jgi:hypothetical protein